MREGGVLLLFQCHDVPLGRLPFVPQLRENLEFPKAQTEGEAVGLVKLPVPAHLHRLDLQKGVIGRCLVFSGRSDRGDTPGAPP